MSIVEPALKVSGHVQIVCKHADGVEFYREEIDNLLTNAGRVWMHEQVYGNTVQANAEVGGNFIALTTDTSAAAATDTTLASEITTGGLARAVATTITLPTAPSGTQTILAKTFTASATHTAVQKSGLFNAASVGTMTHEAVFSPVTLNNTDVVTITWTLTLA